MRWFATSKVLAVTIVLAGAAVAGCSSDSASPNVQVGRQEVKQFTCPTAAAVSTALGRKAPAPRRSSFKDLSAFCSYENPATSTDGQLMVSVTFGTTTAEVALLVRTVYPDRHAVAAAGVGDAASFIAGKGFDAPTLIFQSRDATFSLSGAKADTQATLAKVARLFISR